jgi:hypothetical protein
VAKAKTTKRPDVAERNVLNTVNITGRKFGRLTAKYQTGTGPEGAIWHCECECGGAVDVPYSRLVHATSPTESCGCLQRETAAEHMRAVGSKPNRFIDLTGQTIGKFKVLRFLRFEEGTGAVYMVQDGDTKRETTGKYLRRIQKGQ